ncbi:hypothetical protein EVAR_4532_1 [Eumeta japonica]|uniref:Uncharacterized protein n=1 Tax=Eumeta variegata TaxID=151549 RepID=A0A4C1SWP8_EUMVA|nr:hypothetical protein EVAR_4532_1 [Eumeta japonica]
MTLGAAAAYTQSGCILTERKHITCRYASLSCGRSPASSERTGLAFELYSAYPLLSLVLNVQAEDLPSAVVADDMLSPMWAPTSASNGLTCSKARSELSDWA